MPVQKNKVLMIAATPFFADRGCHIRIYNEIKYLERAGIDVTLCTYGLGYDPPGINQAKIKRIQKYNRYRKLSPGFTWHKIYLDLLLLRLALKEIRHGKPNVVHTHQFESLLIAWIVRKVSKLNFRLIFDCQGSLTEELFRYHPTLATLDILKLIKRLSITLERILLRIPDSTLCSSTNALSTIKTISPQLKNTFVLNDGIDFDLFGNRIPKHDGLKLKKALGIPEKHLVLLYAGSVEKAKGIDAVVSELPIILHHIPNLTLVLLGHGSLLNRYQNRYANLLRAHNLILLGHTSYFDLPKYLAVADYAIEPKPLTSESSGKILNYLAAGIPIICFDNRFNRSVLGDRALYIKSFSQIPDCLAKSNKPVASIPDSLAWESISKTLLTIYHHP